MTLVREHVHAGNELMKKGKLKKALEHFEAALEQRPDSAFITVQKAMLLVTLGDIVAAAKCFDGVDMEADVNASMNGSGMYEIDPGFFVLAPDGGMLVDLLVKKGMVLGVARRWEECIPVWSRVLELDPGNSQAQKGKHVCASAVLNGYR